MIIWNDVKKWLHKIFNVYLRRDMKAAAYYRYLDAGGESLRLAYPLNKSSVIIDAGGYIGDFAADMYQKFECRIDVFEPVAEYAEKIRERFRGNSNIQVIQAGLGATDKKETITIQGLGSSTFGGAAQGMRMEEIQILSAVEYIQSRPCTDIDLMKINIEGGEYELLTSLLDHPEVVKKIGYFQIQFHDFVPGAEEARGDIRRKLSETHKLMWDFPFIWESWELKSK